LFQHIVASNNIFVNKGNIDMFFGNKQAVKLLTFSLKTSEYTISDAMNWVIVFAISDLGIDRPHKAARPFAAIYENHHNNKTIRK
jgi:hypothetical protein